MSRFLVLGSGGQLGTAFSTVLADASFLTRRDVDITDRSAVETVVRAARPEVVINCAAYTAVDKAEEEPAVALSVNANALGYVAEACAASGARLVTFSTDYVFDGRKVGGYVESDEPNPINAYGRSKLAGERVVLQALPGSLVVRTSWLISATHRNFVVSILEASRRGPVRVVDDQRGRATVAADLAVGVRSAVDAGATGILHLSNRGELTWFTLARRIVELAGGDPETVVPVSSAAVNRAAPRPANSVLDSTRLEDLHLDELPPVEASLPTVVAEASRLGGR